MNIVKAEWLKIMKTKFLWVLFSAYTVLFLLLFYQYTLNTSANVIEPALKDPVNLYSLFIAMFSAFLNIVFAVAIGSHLAAKDYTYQTIQNLIQATGRYRSTAAQIAVLAALILGFLIYISLLGMVLGSFFQPVNQFSFLNLIKRLAVGFITTFPIGLFAMTMSKLFKSTAKGNMLCIVLLLGQNFLPATDLTKYLNYLVPYYYVSEYSINCFSNLQNMNAITFRSVGIMTPLQGAVGIIIYIAVCLLIQFIIDKKREYH